jgi:hypothetical protein
MAMNEEELNVPINLRTFPISEMKIVVAVAG